MPETIGGDFIRQRALKYYVIYVLALIQEMQDVLEHRDKANV